VFAELAVAVVSTEPFQVSGMQSSSGVPSWPLSRNMYITCWR
jgi:hypothetical protein